jgi:hypothetical protein
MVVWEGSRVQINRRTRRERGRLDRTDQQLTSNFQQTRERTRRGGARVRSVTSGVRPRRGNLAPHNFQCRNGLKPPARLVGAMLLHDPLIKRAQHRLTGHGADHVGGGPKQRTGRLFAIYLARDGGFLSYGTQQRRRASRRLLCRSHPACREAWHFPYAIPGAVSEATGAGRRRRARQEPSDAQQQDWWEAIRGRSR